MGPTHLFPCLPMKKLTGVIAKSNQSCLRTLVSQVVTWKKILNNLKLKFGFIEEVDRARVV